MESKTIQSPYQRPPSPTSRIFLVLWAAFGARWLHLVNRGFAGNATRCQNVPAQQGQGVEVWFRYLCLQLAPTRVKPAMYLLPGRCLRLRC